MNFFNVYNNATVILNEELIFDPWLYGNLYNNSWYPFGKKTLKKKNLKKIKYCFISHLHQDHWDLDTIKFFPKSTKFFIPDFKSNKIIEKLLIKKGFSNIIYIPIKKFTKIDHKYSLSVVRPLNSEGIETKNKIYDNSITEIDAGVIVKINNDNSNHLLLSDNPPYNLKSFSNDYKKIKINSVFFPFNGYASDYPFCYDNLSLSKKKKLCKEKSIKLAEKIFKFLEKIKPNHAIPYSAQFATNNKATKIFKKVIDNRFFYKEEFVNFFKNKFKYKNMTPLSENHTLYFFKDNFKIKIDNEENLEKLKIRYPDKNLSKKKIRVNLNLLKNDLDTSLKSLFFRIKKNKMNIKKINQSNFYIKINKLNKLFHIDIMKQNFSEVLEPNKIYKKKHLVLKIDPSLLIGILNRKLHINNLIIGQHLNWSRMPNSYNQNIYDCLNFLHK